MGEANLRYAHGETDIAEKLCFEIIRQVPTAAEPFHTLAQIYEADHPEKSLQLSLIAAHLSSHNGEEWIRFANISLEKNDVRQASVCLTKAITADPKNIMYHLRRLEVYETYMTDTLMYLKAGMRLLNVLDGETHSDLLIKYALIVAEGYFKGGHNQKAKEAMEMLFQKCPQHVTLEHVNRMIDLLLGCKAFHQIIELLVEYCSYSIEAEKQTYKNTDGTVEENIVILNYEVPQEVPIDIHAKFLITLIYMKLTNLNENIQNEVEKFNVEQSGDLLFDIAEAFMQENLHSQAFLILDKLVKTEKFSMAAVWLRHAECLQVCRKFTEAIESYKQVIELAPQLADVRMTLSTLLREQGRVNEALVALDQELLIEDLDPHVLIQRCKLLRQHYKFKEYFRDALLLLLRHCIDSSIIQELQQDINISLDDNQILSLDPISEVFINEVPIKSEKKGKDKEKKTELIIEQEWKIYNDILNISYLANQMNLMQRINQSALLSKKFTKEPNYKKQIELAHAISSIYSKDTYNGYNTLRAMILSDVHNVNIWNLFNALLQTPDDCRNHRFVMRLLSRENVSPVLHILHGNNCLVAGTYKYALSEYCNTFRSFESPLAAFLIAVTLFQMACQKNTAKKHSLVVQGHAFLTIYKKLRGADCYHEVHYNFGRAYHQLGVYPLAIHYYKKVLDFDSPLLRQKSRNDLDLKREAAFNISLCYKLSGAKHLALMYLRKYIVV